MGLETGPSKNRERRVLSASEKTAAQREWEQRLTAEGLGALETEKSEAGKIDHVSRARGRALRYYLETPGTQWDMHKAEMIHIQNEMRTAGADAGDIDLFDENFMHEIEDEAALLQRAVHEAFIALIRTKPNLESRPELLERNLSTALQRKFPEYSKEIVSIAVQSFLAAREGRH